MFRTCTYRGASYRLLWIGQTHYGFRAHLSFHDGSRTFWCNGSAVSNIQNGRPVRPIVPGDGFVPVETPAAPVAPPAPVAPVSETPSYTVPPVPVTETPAHTVKQLVYIDYDIPKVNGRPVFANPSGVLRRVAVRTSESVWTVPADRIPHSILNGMIEAGCIVETTRIDREDTDKVVRRIAAALRKEIEAIETSVNESIENAAREMEAAPAEGRPSLSTDERVKGFRSSVRQIVRRKTMELADLNSAATVFGLEGFARTPIQRVTEAVRARATSTELRARAYVTAAERAAVVAAQTRTDSAEAIARAAADDAVPAWALADHLEENGELDAAEELRDAFAD